MALSPVPLPLSSALRSKPSSYETPKSWFLGHVRHLFTAPTRAKALDRGTETCFFYSPLLLFSIHKHPIRSWAGPSFPLLLFQAMFRNHSPVRLHARQT